MLNRFEVMATVSAVVLSAMAGLDNKAVARTIPVPGEGAVAVEVLPVIPAWQTSTGTVSNAPTFSSAGGSIFTPLASTTVGSIPPAANADVAGLWTSLAD